jgi:TRAP-type C4-dicarboxylate transport system permease large subunit
VHLGIVFLANMELGYLTPPVGLNLFFASYRFGKPIAEVFRAVLPLFAALGIALLVVTYVPWFSTGILSLGK